MTVSLDRVLARLTPERRARIESMAAQLIAEEMTLAELRKARKLTQQTLAKKLGIKQESVSNIEARSDMLLSTLRGYVEGLGGKLSLTVEFPNHAPVALPSLAAALGRVGPRAAQPKGARRRQVVRRAGAS